MAGRQDTSVHGITADDTVTHEHYDAGSTSHDWLVIPGNVTLFFDGYGAESEANLLGFLDQMHQIRNALIQDISERMEAVK